VKAGRSHYRLFRILRVIVKHLIAHVVYPHLRRWPRLARTLFGPDLAGPDRFRLAFEEIGGTLIKFGQMLAIQSDLLPLEYCKGLFSLFDRVPSFPYEDVEKTLREDLGQSPMQLFDFFETKPLATGSIGQVHVAMRRGCKYAVKIRRPTVQSDFAADIAALTFISGVVKAVRLKNFYWIISPVEEFVAWTREELDFRREAHYMNELGRNALNNTHEKVPAVLWSCTTARILTIEFLPGITISDHLRNVAEARIQIPSGFDPPVFAAHLINNFLGDAFQHGMFHADLHPGNLMILENNVVGYIDFGISGTLSRYSRHHLIAMTLAYARGDLDAMCDSFFRISTFDTNADKNGFRRSLKESAVDWYGDGEHEKRLRRSITSIMLQLLLLSREKGVWPQRDVIKYIRSAIALDGLIKTFSPTTDIGLHLEQACVQNLSWDSVWNLVSPEIFAGNLDATTHLLRDGLLRASSALRRWAAGSTSPARSLRPMDNQPQRGWLSNVMSASWIVFCLGLVLPVLEQGSFHPPVDFGRIGICLVIAPVLLRFFRYSQVL
jgi:predicted unusual protein kinase regulating ubiquinone biosynthesis (AarF/ABC1/UbiB family)